MLAQLTFEWMQGLPCVAAAFYRTQTPRGFCKAGSESLVRMCTNSYLSCFIRGLLGAFFKQKGQAAAFLQWREYILPGARGWTHDPIPAPMPWCWGSTERTSEGGIHVFVPCLPRPEEKLPLLVTVVGSED